MKLTLILLAIGTVIPVMLCAGCESAALKWEPTVRVIYMPRKFEDGRIMVNPWREPSEVPYGPSYPYELVYSPKAREYQVVLREDAPHQRGGQVTYRRDADPYTLIMPVRH